MILNDPQWSSMILYDPQLPQRASMSLNDLNEPQWASVILNNLNEPKWSSMILNDPQWSLTYAINMERFHIFLVFHIFRIFPFIKNPQTRYACAFLPLNISAVGSVVTHVCPTTYPKGGLAPVLSFFFRQIDAKK